MAEFPGNSRTSTDYQNKTTTIYCLTGGCEWRHSWDTVDVEQAAIGKVFRAHHRAGHGGVTDPDKDQ